MAVATANRAEHLETFYAAARIEAAIVNLDLAAGVGALHAAIDTSDAKAVVCEDTVAKDIATAVRRIGKRWRPTVVVAGPEFEATLASAAPAMEWAPPYELDPALAALPDPSPRTLVAAALVRDSGFRAAISALWEGGLVVLVPGRRVTAKELWRAASAHRVHTLVIEGERFAWALAHELHSLGDELDLGSLRTILSPDAAIHDETRAELTRALPDVQIVAPEISVQRGERPRTRARRSNVPCASTRASTTAMSSRSTSTAHCTAS